MKQFKDYEDFLKRFVALCRWGIKARKYQPTTKLN